MSYKICPYCMNVATRPVCCGEASHFVELNEAQFDAFEAGASLEEVTQPKYAFDVRVKAHGVQRTFNNSASALRWAGQMVYTNHGKWKERQEALDAGQPVSWSYGSTVTITPFVQP